MPAGRFDSDSKKTLQANGGKMGFIYKLFKQDRNSREGVIAVTSGLGVVVNVLIALTKIFIGALVSSIAIISEGANNAADAATSVMTFIGAKLAKKHPDAKHPFGYGRIEYFTSLIIAGLILFTGIEMLISSVELIFHPEELSVNYISLIIVAVTAIIKFFLGIYTIKQGKNSGSRALEGVGLECRNDAFASVITIVSSLVFLIFGLSLDAYAGIIISALIIKAGVEVLIETASDLLGRPGDEELAAKIYKEVRGTEGIIGAADMMLHNYGPDAWSGSVNVEIDHEKTVGEIYEFLHKLQLHIMHDYGVTMVFGVYAVDNDHEEAKQLRREVGAFVLKEELIKSFHAIYVDNEARKLYCDFIVDYKLRDWDALRAKFQEYMAGLHPEYSLELTIETDFV